MASPSFLWVLSVLLAAWGSPAIAQDSDIKQIPLRTHSLATPYLDSEMSSRWWDYGGTTVIRADSYIRLAGQYPSSAGWIFSRVPLTATNWEIEFEFKMGGTASLYGDGMAMWVTKERAEMGPVFGMRDKFEGLGIFFDVYKNNRPGVVFPYVMAMIGDGKTQYDQANDGKANELAGCSARGLRNVDTPTKAKLTYFQDKSLTLDLMYKREDEWTRCFDVPNIKLPSVTYLGFSAETGELSDNFDIVKVDTKNLYSPSGSTNTGNNNNNRDNRRGKNRGSRNVKPGIGFFGWLLRIVGLLLVVGGAYVGFTMYRAKKRDRF